MIRGGPEVAHGGLPWPFGPQVHLLKAAIGPDDQVESAFLAWLGMIDIEDHMDGGSYRLLPLVFERMRGLGLDHALMGRLKGVYRRAWVANHSLFHEAAPAVAALAEAGIPTLLMKGAPLSFTYYQSHATRPMFDLDLAVPVERATEAMERLEALGWKAGWAVKSYELHDSHALDFKNATGAEIDLHWHCLREAPSSDANGWFWGSAQPFDFCGVEVLQPSPTAMLLHTIVHGVRSNDEPPIRWIIDAATIVRTASAELDWDELVRFARSQKLCRRLFLGLDYLAKTYQIPIPTRVLQSLNAAGVTVVERIENVVYLGKAGRIYQPRLYPLIDYWRFLRHQDAWTFAKGFPAYIQRRWRLSHPAQFPVAAAAALFHQLRRPGSGKAAAAPRKADLFARLSAKQAALFDPASWSLLWRYFARQRRGLLLIALLGILQSVVLLPTLYFVRYAFDVAVPHALVGKLIWIGVGLVVFRVAASVLMLTTRALSLRLGKGAISDLRRDLVATLYDLPRDYFGRNDAADIHTRIVIDTERLDNLTSSTMSTVLPAVLTSALLVVVLVYLNWWLALSMAALLPVMWLSTLFAGQNVQREVRGFQTAFDGFSRGVHFVLRQMDMIRLRAYEDKELDRQTERLDRLKQTGVGMAMSYARLAQIQSGVTGVGGLVLLIVGGIAVAKGATTMGDLLAFYLAAGFLNGNLNKVLAVAPDVIAGNESLRKLAAFRKEAEAPIYTGRASPGEASRISLRDVSFGYDRHLLLENISLDIAPRSNIAIIGANGAGKTTIINLILGYYRPLQGGVFVDGAAYDDIDIRALRRSIGVVPQRPTFFTGTIAENIGYGWPDIGRDDIKAAAAKACADIFVQRLPHGYDTVIGEGGALLSGGEAQRLAIARALIGRPGLLILDEPTNHLDAQVVGEIMSRLIQSPARPSVLTISHDPAVIAFADAVLRLEARRLRADHGQPLAQRAV